MITLTVYKPALYCSTGICGTDIDQRLVNLAADLDWLKAQCVTVRRFGLSREPAEFAANDIIRQIKQDSDGDDLPVFLVDGVLRAKARYPGRVKLADWASVADIQTMQARWALSCCGGSAKAAHTQTKAASCY